MAKAVHVRAAATAEFDEVAAFCAGRERDDATRAIRRRRRQWLEETAARGLTVLWAVDRAPPARLDFPEGPVAREELTLLADGLAVGLLEFVPGEETLYPVEGEGWLVVNCLWVIPPYLKRGVGRALVTEVIRRARALESGIAVIGWRGRPPARDWAFMPPGFFKALGFEVVDEEGDRVLMAASYGAKRRPKLARPAEVDADGVEFRCHPSCPASEWAAAAVRDASHRDAVTVTEPADGTETRDRGVFMGVCRKGRVIVNRLAFKADVDAVVASGDGDSASH